MRVYLAGPMTGLPRYGFDAFEAAAADVRALGATVWSPHERDLELGFDPERPIEEQGFDLRAALEADVQEVTRADVVALLPGWEASLGSMIELVTADAAGIPALPLDELLQLLAPDAA